MAQEAQKVIQHTDSTLFYTDNDGRFYHVLNTFLFFSTLRFLKIFYLFLSNAFLTKELKYSGSMFLHALYVLC